MTVSTVDSLFCRFVDGDVEEDVDFVRFMIGWEKSEVGAEFFALQKYLDLTKPKKHSTIFVPWIVWYHRHQRVKEIFHFLSTTWIVLQYSIIEAMINWSKHVPSDLYTESRNKEKINFRS